MRQAGLPLICLMLLYAGTVYAAPSQLYFSDDFSGAGEKAFFEGILDDRSFSYENGEYEIDTTRGTSYGQSVLLESLSNYRVEVTARMVSTADERRGGFGLSLNYRQREGADAGDFLLFMAYNRGAFTVLRYLNGETSVLYSPTKTQLVKAGQPVTLAVDAANGHFSFYIDGAQVAQVDEDRLKSGGFGMFCTAQSVARFSNLKVFADKPKPSASIDDFSGPKTLFEGEWGGASYRYTDGRYVIDTSKTEYIGLSPFKGEALDFELAADVQLVSGNPEGGYGVYIRDYKSGDIGFNQFRFLLSGDWCAVEQSVDDRPLALAQWAQNKAVKANNSNRIKIVAKGRELVYYINGVEVWRGEDTHPHNGAFGFYASGGIVVAFDNLSITMH